MFDVTTISLMLICAVFKALMRLFADDFLCWKAVRIDKKSAFSEFKQW